VRAGQQFCGIVQPANCCPTRTPSHTALPEHTHTSPLTHHHFGFGFTHTPISIYTYGIYTYIPQDLEWRVIYVGSAVDSHQDQILDEILVGPVPVGLNKFVLQADPPNVTRLPELLGVTVVLVTCSYKEREFLRVGYYVNNEYVAVPPAEHNDGTAASTNGSEEQLLHNTPPPPLNVADMDLKLVQRQILADKPRVTKFPIPWGSAAASVGRSEEGEEEASTTNTKMAETLQFSSMVEKLEESTQFVSTPSTAAGTDMEME
jgi:histone chaperone ASF1